MRGDEEVVQTNLRPIVIGNLRVDNPILPAPLAGFTDSPFRVLLKRHGASLVYTEMISSGGVVKDPEGSRTYLKRREEEGSVGYQLAGGNVEWMVHAARVCQDAGAALIDINAGCTDKNVRKQGGGAALVERPELLCDIISKVGAAVSLPVTCKLRLPKKGSGRTGVDIAEMCQDAGAAMVTIHARDGSSRFGGRADWKEIRRIKNALDIPVVGNGDVRNHRDAARMIMETGCDGVMLGRAVLGAPWLPGSIYSLLSGGPDLTPPNEKLVDLLFDLSAMKLEDKGDRRCSVEMRYTFSKFLRGRGVSKKLWNRAVRVSDYTEILEVLSDLRAEMCHG